MPAWLTFYFDGNSWCGVVDSPKKFKKLLEAYNGDLTLLLDRAMRAPVSEIAKVPSSYFLGEAKKTRTGEMPNFGFRGEHTGPQTLGDWIRAHNIDLSQATPQ